MNSAFGAGRGRFPGQRRCRALLLATLLAAAGGAAGSGRAQDCTVVCSAPGEPVAGGRIVVWLHYLNGADSAVTRPLPARLEGRLWHGTQADPVVLERQAGGAQGEVRIPARGFAREAYVLPLPASLRGRVQLELTQEGVQRVGLDIRPASGPPASQTRQEPAPPPPGDQNRIEAGPSSSLGPSPAEFFKAHFFTYEPFYFLLGTESPNAKFQLSFKYRVLNNEGALASHLPVLRGLHFGYTQTSLWDWNRPSAPFLDTSYKPELLYSLDRVDRGRWGDWLHLDLQGGVQHESNGRDGLASRSLNLFYVRPALTFGREDGFRFTLMPRAWVYLPDLEDNPDLPDYRGNVDLRATVGWARGLQLSSQVRVGDDGNRGSLTLDLTYPLNRVLTRSLSVYLNAQYFTGYGESFLLYRERTSMFRLGFALFR